MCIYYQLASLHDLFVLVWIVVEIMPYHYITQFQINKLHIIFCLFNGSVKIICYTIKLIGYLSIDFLFCISFAKSSNFLWNNLNDLTKLTQLFDHSLITKFILGISFCTYFIYFEISKCFIQRTAKFWKMRIKTKFSFYSDNR